METRIMTSNLIFMSMTQMKTSFHQSFRVKIEKPLKIKTIELLMWSTELAWDGQPSIRKSQCLSTTTLNLRSTTPMPCMLPYMA